MQLNGEYFQPFQAASETAVLYVNGTHISLFIGNKPFDAQLEITSVHPGNLVVFQDGSQFQCRDELPQELVAVVNGRRRKYIRWLEKFTWYKAVLLFACVAIFVALARFGLSIAVGSVAYMVPESWEANIGRSAYFTIDRLAFEDSKLSPQFQKNIVTKARKMAQDAGLERNPGYFFHHSPRFGANALAFPGGPIVITDDLVHLLDDEDELLAVIAHELTHVEERHSLKQLLEISGIAIIASFLFGADDTLIEEIVLIATDIWAFKNSRDFEKHADLGALRILKAAGRDGQDLAGALRKLTDQFCPESEGENAISADCEGDEAGWLSTHPSGQDRQKYIAEHLH